MGRPPWDPKYDLREACRGQPPDTAPVSRCTNWMYESRRGELSDEEYAKKMETKHKAFLKNPKACRSAVGQVFYKDSKLDWEIRVFMAPLVFAYVLVKVDEEKALAEGDEPELKKLKEKRGELLDDAMKKLLERFPDCRPSHRLRKIREKFGEKAENKFLAGFRNRFANDAGRMKTTYLKTQGKVSTKGSRSSVYTVLEILGKTRAHIAFHWWGGSKAGGKDDCDAEIERRMALYRSQNPTLTPQEVSRHRITVVHTVRFDLFKLQTLEVRQLWAKRAKTITIPKTPEEEQILVNAALPYFVELLGLLAERADMHFLLLGAAKGSSNVQLVFQEFCRRDESEKRSLFLSSFEGVGARLRADYLTYAVERYGGDINEAVIGLPEAELELEDDDALFDEDDDSGKGEKEETAKGGKLNYPRPTYVEPFRPDTSKVTTESQMCKALSDFIMTSLHKIHGGRIVWDKVTKYAETYIETNRMPMDPHVHGQRLQVQKPAVGVSTDRIGSDRLQYPRMAGALRRDLDPNPRLPDRCRSICRWL